MSIAHLRRLVAAILLLVGLWSASATTTAAQSTTCQFILGFQALHDLDAGDIGDCVDNQAFAPNGDAQQHTTKGLMAWRKADNWTAFTNGYTTWINGPMGLAKRLNTDRFPWEAPAAPAPAGPPSTTPGSSSVPGSIPSCLYTSQSGPAGARPFVDCSDPTLVVSIVVPSKNTVNYSFDYPNFLVVPQGNAMVTAQPQVTFTAKIPGVASYDRANVGINTAGYGDPNTWSLASSASPWDSATLQATYTSGRHSLVTVQLVNFTATPLTFQFSWSGLNYPGATSVPIYVPLALTRQ